MSLDVYLFSGYYNCLDYRYTEWQHNVSSNNSNIIFSNFSTSSGYRTRVYIPENFLKKHQLNANILTKKSSCQNFDKMKIEIISKVENLLKDVKENLQLIDIWKLKKETLIILNIAKRLCFLLFKIN